MAIPCHWTIHPPQSQPPPWQTHLAEQSPTTHPPLFGWAICCSAFWPAPLLTHIIQLHTCLFGSPVHDLCFLAPPPPSLLPAASATRYYADAARTPWGLFSAGIWSPQMGCRFFFCPPWVLTQQTAELFAAFKALSLAAYRRDLSIHLFLDNHAAIFSLLRGKARSSLAPQNRLLRRVCYLLHWSGLIAALHYIPSSLNPADPPSRWWAYPSSFSLVRHTCMLGLSHLLDPPDLPWGTLAGLQRHF